jgi:hypothetical protein
MLGWLLEAEVLLPGLVAAQLVGQSSIVTYAVTTVYIFSFSGVQILA